MSDHAKMTIHLPLLSWLASDLPRQTRTTKVFWLLAISWECSFVLAKKPPVQRLSESGESILHIYELTKNAIKSAS
jgi:hypothetical protein